jgi:hypothetical protein
MSLAMESALLSEDELGELENQLQAIMNGRVAGLHLAMQPDGLVLQGRARTYYAKQLAQQALMKATPLPIAANEIDVR